MHLLNVKRIGEEIRPYRDPLRERPATPPPAPGAPAAWRSSLHLPEQASGAAGAAFDVARVVDEFLSGFREGRR